MADSLWYPSVEDVLAIHDDVVLEHSETPAGVIDRGDIEFALQYIDERALIRHQNDPQENVSPFGPSRCESAVRRREQTHRAQNVPANMATDEGTETASPLDEVLEDIRRELVRRVAADDRESNRDVYDSLESE